MNNDFKIPTGVYFSSFLNFFMEKHDVNNLALARSMPCSVFTIWRLRSGKSFPTERAYAEFSIFFAVVEGKSFDAYKKMNQKDKNDLVAKIIAGGGSITSIGGVIALISASGVVAGLSAVGITSGLAAVGAVVGGGMLAGIAVVAAIPVAIGGILYHICRSKEKNPTILYEYQKSLHPDFEKMNA